MHTFTSLHALVLLVVHRVGYTSDMHSSFGLHPMLSSRSPAFLTSALISLTYILACHAGHPPQYDGHIPIELRSRDEGMDAQSVSPMTILCMNYFNPSYSPITNSPLPRVLSTLDISFNRIKKIPDGCLDGMKHLKVSGRINTRIRS